MPMPSKGLRLIEVDKSDLVDLPDIVDVVADRPERFIVFCDDLSFEDGEPGYKALKSILDGSVSAAGQNVLIYATSNRRHLLPEYMKENLSYTHTDDGEVHPGEVVEEKISLVRTVWSVGQFLPFQPRRIPDHRFAMVGIVWRRRPRPPRLLAHRHWCGHLSAVLAVGEWPTSLRATMPERTPRSWHDRYAVNQAVLLVDGELSRQTDGKRNVVEVAVGVLIDQIWSIPFDFATAGQGLCGLLGVSWRQAGGGGVGRASTAP